jgi:hypothetical protein
MLEGNALALRGSFSGLLAVPIGAHLHMGTLPGVRGPRIAELGITHETSGTLNASIQLSPQQREALLKGDLYIEIDSGKAPEGDLWGWIMP